MLGEGWSVFFFLSVQWQLWGRGANRTNTDEHLQVSVRLEAEVLPALVPGNSRELFPSLLPSLPGNWQAAGLWLGPLGSQIFLLFEFFSSDLIAVPPKGCRGGRTAPLFWVTFSKNVLPSVSLSEFEGVPVLKACEARSCPEQLLSPFMKESVEPVLRTNFAEQMLTMVNQEHSLECPDTVEKLYSF